MQNNFDKDKNNKKLQRTKPIFKQRKKQKYIIKGFDYMINKKLTKEECILLLPHDGYEIKNCTTENIIEKTNLRKYGISNETESNFFINLVRPINEVEKLVYIYLLKIYKGDRLQRKLYFTKISKSLNNYNVEKIILFLLNFELSQQIVKKFIKLLITLKETFKKERLFLFTIFTYHKFFRNEAIEGVQKIADENFENFINIIRPNDMDNLFELKCKLVAISILNFGYKINLNFFYTNVVHYNKLNIFLNAHLHVFTFVNTFLEDYVTEALCFLKSVCNLNYSKFEKIILNIVSHLASKDLLSYNENKYFFDFYYLKYQQNNSETILGVLSYLAINDQTMSINLFKIIKNLKSINQNIIKILDRIIENLEYNEVIDYTLVNLYTLLSNDNEKIIGFFNKILPCCKLESKMFNLLLDESCKEVILKIFVKAKVTFSDSVFKENFFILLKNNDLFSIKNLFSFIKKLNNDKIYFNKIFELGKSKIMKCSLSEKAVFGYYILENILIELNTQELQTLGTILFEKIEITEDTNLIHKFSLLTKIYEISSFKSFSELIIELSPYLKIKNFFIKEHVVTFIDVILKKNINIQHNINKVEFLRICYEVAEYLSICYYKNTKAVDLIYHLSKFIPPQEIVNICTEFIEQNVKKGLINALSNLSKHVGCFNVLPVLLVDYKYTQHKLVIVKIISKMQLDVKCQNIIIPLLEDCLLKKDISFRSAGLKLLTSIIKHSTIINVNIILHYINISWFNVLDENFEIKENFNELIVSIVTKFGGDFLYKYVIIGMYHPSKKIKKRYLDIYEIIKEYGMNTFSFTEQLWNK